MAARSGSPGIAGGSGGSRGGGCGGRALRAAARAGGEERSGLSLSLSLSVIFPNLFSLPPPLPPSLLPPPPSSLSSLPLSLPFSCPHLCDVAVQPSPVQALPAHLCQVLLPVRTPVASLVLQIIQLKVLLTSQPPKQSPTNHHRPHHKLVSPLLFLGEQRLHPLLSLLAAEPEREVTSEQAAGVSSDSPVHFVIPRLPLQL